MSMLTEADGSGVAHVEALIYEITDAWCSIFSSPNDPALHRGVVVGIVAFDMSVAGAIQPGTDPTANL